MVNCGQVSHEENKEYQKYILTMQCCLFKITFYSHLPLRSDISTNDLCGNLNPKP